MIHPHDIYEPLEPWTVRITSVATALCHAGCEVKLVYHLARPEVTPEVAATRQEFPFEVVPLVRHARFGLKKLATMTRLARWADVVHFQKCFSHVSLPAATAAYLRGVPLHYDWDDWEAEIYRSGPHDPAVAARLDRLERALPRIADTVSVASAALREQVRALGVPDERIAWAPVGADLARFRPGRDRGRMRAAAGFGDAPLALYVGQLHNAQYADLFVRAAKEVLRTHPDARFAVVGSGSREKDLHRIAGELGLGESLVFTGSVPHEDVADWMAAADVAVACFEDTPQVRTKSPLKVVEYLAAGKAMVVSRVGEAVEMVEHGRCGLLVEPGSVPDLARGIAWLFDHPEERRSLERLARERAESTFSWGATAMRIRASYRLGLALHGLSPEGRPPVRGRGPTGEEARPAHPAAGGAPEMVLAGSPIAVGAELLNDGGVPDGERAGVGLGFPRGAAVADGLAGAAGTAVDAGLAGLARRRDPSLKPFAGVRPPPRRPQISPREVRGLPDALRGYVDERRELLGILHGEHAFTGPYLLQLDITNRCNNDCIACWLHSPLLNEHAPSEEEKRKQLPFELICQLVADVAAMGTKEVYLAGGGDPFVHPRILDVIEVIKKAGMYCYVNTNFNLVEGPVLDRVLDLGLDEMTVSVWAGTGEAYARTHPNKTEEQFQRLKRALTELNRRKRDRPLIKVYHVVSTINCHEMEEMVDFVLETGSEWVEFTVVDTIPGATDAILFDEEQRQRLHRDSLRVRERLARRGLESVLYNYDQWLRRISTPDAVVGNADANIVHTFPCSIGWTFARVMPDGRITSCLKSHRIPVGNLHENRFPEIWNGPKQRYFRRKTRVVEKRDPFFQLIGNDPGAACGCEKSCDDLGRNMATHRRMEELAPWERRVLQGLAQALPPDPPLPDRG